MDRTDRRILHELQQDGRLTNAELADRVGLTPSPCLRRGGALGGAGGGPRVPAAVGGGFGTGAGGASV